MLGGHSSLSVISASCSGSDVKQQATIAAIKKAMAAGINQMMLIWCDTSCMKGCTISVINNTMLGASHAV